jgi:hypothetical protein
MPRRGCFNEIAVRLELEHFELGDERIVVGLKIQHGDSTITLSPEYPEILEPTFPHGSFDGGCSNGEFKFSWDIQKGWIKASVTKSGDGRGGSSDVKIRLNAEECEDLKTKLLYFRDVVRRVRNTDCTLKKDIYERSLKLF